MEATCSCGANKEKALFLGSSFLASGMWLGSIAAD